MRFVARLLASHIEKARRSFGAVLLTGPRQAGKTSLLRRLLPKATYVLLDDPAAIARARSDPQAFLDELALPVILDEIQNVPELFGHIRARIDRDPRRKGQWLLTGSQEAPIMKGVSESMAGRVAIFHLMPLSLQESSKVSELHGGYPGVVGAPRASETWFRSYLQTYIERDVRAVTSIRDLAVFRRFLSLLATRAAQTLNKTDLASPLGVSVPTIAEWLSILEVTQQIVIVPPYYENLGKRLIKSPKVYFADSGLLCHLLNVTSRKILLGSPFRGAVFENYVAAEIAKAQLNQGRRRELYFFRDAQGLEVDFLVPRVGGRIQLIEAKANATPRPEMARAIRALAPALDRATDSHLVVFPGPYNSDVGETLAPGIRAVTIERMLELLR
jgi:uncharacterized protein